MDLIKEITEGNTQIKNNSCNGECSKCGECCTHFLPVCQEEIDKIQEYVILNNIKPQIQMMIMQNTLTCPYYNGNKCLIYEVRPLICREFYCYKPASIEMAQKFKGKDIIPVNMWAIAQEIEIQRKKYYGGKKNVNSKSR